MSWLSEELSGWPIGSGYYSTSVGTDEAKGMARAIEEALLAVNAVERAARGIHASHDRGEDFDNELQSVQDEYLDMAEAALVAAIEGGE